MSREQSKAAHYIQQLDAARCDGAWDTVPELVRKIRKHAPQRTCLAITAEAEHAVSQAAQYQYRSSTARPQTARPTTANSSKTRGSEISRFIPLLLEAIEKENIHVEDEFQAQVCLGWIHWQLEETSLAVARLPKSIEQDFAQLDGTNKESAEWTKVSAIKATYIKGKSLGKTGALAEALETFDSALPILSSISSTARQGKELRTWTELFLTAFCMISSLAIKSKITSILETEALSAFRSWAKFWDTISASPTGGRAVQSDVSRRQVWMEYYITLSDLLEQELPFPTTALTTAYTQTSTKLQQRAELKRVETRYEALLLSEVDFPKAEEASEEVESFVEPAMRNWRILCGSSWHENDLGEGGSEAVSKGVLDILYRAATKTFHSTAILRHLFTVHLAVAEFDLAFKAFDTYIDIVKKGKAREEKTGDRESSLDDDETVLRTVSECIKALCRYGSFEGAEKAQDLGHFFEDWLEKHHPVETPKTNGHFENGPLKTTAVTPIAPQIFAMAWRCIGIGYAQWARVTFDAQARPEIQLKAIKCFKKSLLPEFESTTDVETLFALGTLLAERRELSKAIEVVKAGLTPRSSTSFQHALGPYPGRFSRERALIPLWHLLALLLSARQEFLTASRSCEGAFEQFQDPRNLFGEGDISGNFRSAHLNEKASSRTQGVVDDMDDFEKESVLEVKMTQLALIEILEGPEVAVNASDELLGLYARLFGDPNKGTDSSLMPNTALALPPQSSAGTIRSIKGSIFGRSGRSIRKTHTSSGTMNETSLPMRPQTTQTLASTTAPIIQITNENGGATQRRPSTKKSGEHHHEKLQKRSGSVTRKIGSSIRNRSTSTARARSSSEVQHSTDAAAQEQWFSGNQETVKSKSHPPVSQNMKQKEKSLKAAPSIAQGNRLPHIPFTYLSAPMTRFPKDQERRRRTAILVKLWLLISGFYRRASMPDDARGAIEEAQKLVHNLEQEDSKDTSGNASTSQSDWAGGKSVGALWGDVFAERGHLAVAANTPYVALEHYENALTHFADHPSAIIGLSNILLDIYTEDLLPPPSIPQLNIPSPLISPSASIVNTSTVSSVTATPLTTQPPPLQPSSSIPFSSHGPLGLPGKSSATKTFPILTSTPDTTTSSLQPSYKESSTALLDRLAARDRAYGLLNTLTKLGTGWNCSDAWFALARAYEEGGQPDKAREVLWWCVELEEARGVREWGIVSAGGYVL